tara:strand:- start:346 stop:1158 length:813 start_codon:yes stop_codon:yes gene_type:complete
MAISVNTVYQTVLYILNKEQRGYAPPDEFNSIANQVQLEIFNSYFPDGSQINRQNQRNTQNDTEYFNTFDNLSYRITPFIQEVTLLPQNTPPGGTAVYGDGISFFYPAVDPTTGNSNPEIYLFGEVTFTYNGSPKYESVAQRTSKKEYTRIEKSKLTKPTSSYPIYYNYGVYNPSTNINSGYSIITSPVPDSVTASVVMWPNPPIWNFTGGSYGQYIYSSSNSNDFSLDISEQTNLVTNILKYFGIVINDPTIIQTATQEAAKVEQNEKA